MQWVAIVQYGWKWLEENGWNNFDVSLLGRYLRVYDAVAKALMGHMPKTSVKRMTGWLATANKEGRVEIVWISKEGGVFPEDAYVMIC